MRTAGINLMLTVFDPDGLWPMIENAQQVSPLPCAPGLAGLAGAGARRGWRVRCFRRIAAWHPDMVGPGGELLADEDDAEADGAPPPVLPVIVQAGRFRASLFSTLTTLGIPQDVTLEELRIECFFPADEATRDRVRVSGRHPRARERARVVVQPESHARANIAGPLWQCGKRLPPRRRYVFRAG